MLQLHCFESYLTYNEFISNRPYLESVYKAH